MKRRDFIKTLGLTGSAVAVASVAPTALSSTASLSPQTTPSSNSKVPLDGIAMADLVRTGKATPKELAQEAIEKIKKTNVEINAMVTDCFDQALERADNINKNAPFAGVPLLIKDCVDVAGVRSTNGSRLMQNNIPKESSDFVIGCEDAGFNILGMSNSPEFTTSSSTENHLFGATRNPWNLTKSVGGSSGGGAASVAAGYSPIAHGTDGGGSCRLPASACGIFGYKPSRNLLLSGATGGKPDFVLTHSSFMSRSVRDTALATSLTEQHLRPSDKRRVPLGYVTEPTKRSLRVGVTLKNMYGDTPDKETQKAIAHTVKLLRDLGHDVVEVSNPVNGSQFIHNFTAVFGSRLGQLGKMLEAQSGVSLEESKILGWQVVGWIREFERNESRNSNYIEQGFDYMAKLDNELNTQFYKGVDVWLTPTMLNQVNEHKLTDPNLTSDFDTFKKLSLDVMSYTPIANLADNAAMSVPLYWTPEACQLVAISRQQVVMTGCCLSLRTNWNKLSHGLIKKPLTTYRRVYEKSNFFSFTMPSSKWRCFRKQLAIYRLR